MPEPFGMTIAERRAASAVSRFLRALATLPEPHILADVDGMMQIVVDRHVITFKIHSVEDVDA